MKKKLQWAQILIFLGFITLFFVLNLVSSDIDFSEQENRYLQQKPKFSFSSLFSGKYTSAFETYVTDQFEFRDTWITLKARCELLMGKKENNGVNFCRARFSGEGDMLASGFKAPDTKTLYSNMAAVNALSSQSGVPVYFALIPDKAEIYAGRLPSNAPNASEKDIIDYCYAQSEARTVDMLSPLKNHADEYIFYRTDHHWTSRGAYYGYTALAGAMEFPVNDIGHYEVERVSDDFFGTLWSSSGFSWVAPDSIDIFVGPPDDLSITNYPSGTPVTGSLYDYSFLSKKDKYAFFMGGNTPLQVIETGADHAPSLLILRDSYADSLIPFLLDDFSQIHLMDLRYYRAGLSEYLKNNHIDEILVIYSVSNFCTDSNIFLMGNS